MLVFSICAVHDVVNLPECGACEGQMHEWFGHIVACQGAEHVAARAAVGISQQFLCGRDGTEDIWALIDAPPIKA